jgi:hypothetical protein
MSRERRPGFRIGDEDGDDRFGIVDAISDSGRAGFFDVQLHERAGVDVQDHRRSSITRSDTSRRVRDFTRGA